MAVTWLLSGLLHAQRPGPMLESERQPHLSDCPAYFQPLVVGPVVAIPLCLILRDAGVIGMKIHDSLLPRQGFDVGDEALGHRYPPPRYTGPRSTPTLMGSSSLPRLSHLTLSDSVVILMEGFFCVVAVLAPQRRFRPGWPPSVSLFPAGTPLVAAVPKK